MPKNNAVNNMIIMIEDLHNGKYDDYSKSSITRLNKSIGYLKEKSSSRFINENFDFTKPFDLDLIKELLGEFKLNITDENDVYNVNLYHAYDPTGSSTCELCRSSHNCKQLYKIENKYTKKYLWVGSQCIKKFDIPVYKNGEKVKSEDVQLIFNDIEKMTETYKKTKINKIFDFCNKNNETIISCLKKVPRVGLNGGEKISYKTAIDNYINCIYTMFIYHNNGEQIPEEVLIEARSQYFPLLEWSQKMGANNFVTFIPGIELMKDNYIRYMGLFKIVLSYLISRNIKKEKLNIDTVYEFIKDINPSMIHDFRYIQKWLQERAERNNNSYDLNDILSVIIILPEDDNCYNCLEKMYFRNSSKVIEAIYSKLTVYCNYFEAKDIHTNASEHFRNILPYFEEFMEEIKANKEKREYKKKTAKDFREKHHIKTTRKRKVELE